jgi:DNA-binding transcriptional ArsR family regulator
MVTNAARRLDAAFSALSDPTRRAILIRLARGEATVSQIAAPFDISRPAVSKHLTVLDRAGLVSRHRQGREVLCRLEPGLLGEASEWLDRHRAFWNRQLDQLASRFEDEPRKGAPER